MGALLVAAGGAVVGLAVEFHYLGWTSIPGGSCGSDYDPCPDGTTPTLLLAFLFTFGGIGALGGAFAWFTGIRPGKALPAVLASAGVLVALWPGWQAYLWMRGPVLDPVWQAGPDRPATVRGLGVWTVGEDAGTVVRVRGDALVAYDSRAGDRRWILRAPVREAVCGMSDTVVDGTGLVAFGRYGKACDTIWGVDVGSGRKVWEQHISGVPLFTSGSDSLLAADTGVAVALVDGAVRGYGLADGAPRWTAKLTEPDTAEDDDLVCQPQVASAAGGSTRVVVTCVNAATDSRSAHLVTLDNATGKERGNRELPVESSVSTVMVVSADPFTLLLKEEDERGVAAVLAYAGTGGDPVSIPLTADEEDLVVSPESSGSFTARPALQATVSDGALVVATRKPGADYPEGVSAYALSDGQRLWHADLGTTVIAVAPAGKGRVAVLGATDRLWTLASGDGRRVGESDGTMLRDVDGKIENYAQLLKADDTWIVVNSDGDSHPPVLALRP